MTYFKIFAISVCSSLLFLSLFVMMAFDSENTLSQAYEHYSNKEYYEARRLLTSGENPIPLADFYLYEAYLAREELGLKKSQGYLLQATEELTHKKSSTALEIALNLALDAYLQKNADALQTAIEQSQRNASPDEPWIHFFTGCHAYLERNYARAFKSLEASKSRVWLSNWMKTSFEKFLSKEQIELISLHSEIEAGQGIARKKLEYCLLTFPEKHHDDIRCLLALSYIQEGNQRSFDKRKASDQKAIELLNSIPLNNFFFVQEKQHIFDTFKRLVFKEINQHHFIDLSLYLTALETWQASEQLESMSVDIAKIFNEEVMTGNSEEAAILLQGLSGNLPESRFKSIFTMKLTKHFYNNIAKGNLRHINEFWTLYRNFLSDDNHTLPLLADITASKILELLENDNSDFDKTIPFINLWKSLEKNSLNRYALAQQLVHQAQRFWSVNGEAQKAISLLKIAEFLPFATEQKLIHCDIESAIAKTYRQAVLRDHIQEFSFFNLAVQEFNLSNSEILDPMESANQLADAEYLFSMEQYSLAATKTKWVLQVDPNNQNARKIAAQIAYAEGRYHDLVEHIKFLKTIDSSLNEALTVSKLLANARLNSTNSEALAEREFLSQESKLRLAFEFLFLSQPDNSLFWLNQVYDLNDEILTGFCIAAFQKQEWEKVISLYNKMSSHNNLNPALHGIAIQALIAQNQKEKANEIFTKFFALNSPYHIYDDKGSQPFILLQNHLSYFDANDFAARYYLHVRNDPENALQKFLKITNCSPELLLERANLAYSLKLYSESIQDLQKSLLNAHGPIREQALTLLGRIHLQLGFYPDSVHYFEELFKVNPVQNPSVHQSFCQALIAIGRSDLATSHFNLLGNTAPHPFVSPQELPFDLDSHTPAHKRLKILEIQMTQYPNNVSLQMMLVKELLLRSEKSEHSSEELLLAFETIETLLEEHPGLPEMWFLQGQILARLHLNDAAKKSFSKSIALCPNYAEAFKKLALINIDEDDLFTASYNLKQTLQIAPYDLEAWNSLTQIQNEPKRSLS